MNWRNLFTVYAKELRETLRDRRALISMFVLPTVAIPLLMFGVGTLTAKVVNRARSAIPEIMVIGGEDSPLLRDALANNPRFKVVPQASDYAARISSKQLRAAVDIPPGFDASLQTSGKATITIYTHEGEMRSGFAAGELERFLRDYREKIVQRKLADRGLPANFVRPFEVSRQNVAAPEKVGGSSFGGFVPYIFILLCFTGAMYPAMDLTAGEKERGTMETILCSPVSRLDLALGKFLVVLTASLSTVLCSVISLTITATLLAPAMLKGAMGGAIQLPTLSPLGVLGVFLLVVPVAMLFSATLLTVALFAKTYKEAQTYVSPLIFVVLLPAIIATLPGVELDAKLSLVPILNVALVSKEMVAGSFPLGSITLIFVSTCAYAGLALALAVRMFNRENVIFRV